MSFVTAIRDYVEALNAISESLGQNLTVTSFLSETFLYVLKTLQSGLLYFVSLQWIRDFTLLPIVLPQISSAILKETFFLETPSKVFFEFLEIPDLHQNKFLLGFFNSFFLSLPFSIIHILSVRRLLIQGLASGVYSIGGYLGGQILFLTFTVFGIRQILVPWLTLEPLNYVLGLIVIFRTIYSMTQENLTESRGWFLPQYRGYFLTSFLLAWCEQSSLFQYLGNITLSSNVTLLESFSSNSSISSFLTHFLYILGISCGCAIFTCFWGFLFLQVKNWCILYTPLFLSSFIQWINKTSFVLALALSLSSIPFYGFDYIMTGPFGFLSQDILFKNTVFDQTRLKDVGGVGLLSSSESNYEYVDLDVAPFDRGEYLTAPDVRQPLSFEDLNYRGEFDWATRNDKVSGISDSRSGLLTLSKVFRKQKKTGTDFQDQSPLTETSKLNSLLGDMPPDSDLSEIETNPEIANRFTQFYDVHTADDELGKFMKPYQQVYNASFPPDYFRTDPLVERGIEQKIKDKYYSNPVYKALLTADIDLFLKRQPQTFRVTADQEADLYTKRRILESYYDSLRKYSDLPYNAIFDSFFDGAKSFSNKVYNQQFKGTLRSVRRLFALRVDLDSKPAQTLLKFDQPLYEFSEKAAFSPYHEELVNQQEKAQNQFPFKSNFLNQPLYAGWDEQTRKFVITNKFLPRTLAGYKVNIDNETRRKFSQDSRKQVQKIKFTAWPLSSKEVSAEKLESDIPYVTLFQPVDREMKDYLGIEGDFSTFPPNVERLLSRQARVKKGAAQDTREIFESLAPKRGGFIWPGNSKFKFPFSLNP
jgi:hypothetical protein